MDCLWLALAIAYLNVLDYYTTRVAGFLGMRELNPVMLGGVVDIAVRVLAVGAGLVLSGFNYCVYALFMVLVYAYVVLVNVYFISYHVELGLHR